MIKFFQQRANNILVRIKRLRFLVPVKIRRLQFYAFFQADFMRHMLKICHRRLFRLASHIMLHIVRIGAAAFIIFRTVALMLIIIKTFFFGHSFSPLQKIKSKSLNSWILYMIFTKNLKDSKPFNFYNFIRFFAARSQILGNITNFFTNQSASQRRRQ